MSPAAGRLGVPHEDWLKRVTAYAESGACAVSVLTEPSRFDGSLEHLRQASAALAPLKVPTMRKDFLVDPYQVLEARAAGAGGVLLIVRMLSRSQMLALLDAAAEHGLFVLLEAFDAADLHAARELLARAHAGWRRQRLTSCSASTAAICRRCRWCPSDSRHWRRGCRPIGRPWRRAASHPRPTPCA